MGNDGKGPPKKEKKKWEPPAPPTVGKRKKKTSEGTKQSKVPVVTPHAKCRLRPDGRGCDSRRPGVLACLFRRLSFNVPQQRDQTVGGNDIGIFLRHVEQVHGMRHLAAVIDAFVRHDDPEVE